MSATIGALLPENTILVDESMTSGRGLMPATRNSPPHDWLGNTGGSIGIALPLAVGAAVAAPDRRVLCLTADGSAMYTLQALWTMAREGLKVTTVVFANRTYTFSSESFLTLELANPGRERMKCSRSDAPTSTGCSWRKEWEYPARGSLRWMNSERRCGQDCEGEGPTLIEVPL